MKTCPACLKTYSDDTDFCLDDGTRLAAPVAVADAQLAAGLSRRYRIVRRLGKGGMGTVFLAEQTGVGNRLVALKVLNRKFLADPDFLMRFQNEAGSTGRIHHPNVVTIHEAAQGDDGTPYIAMEFLEGESLREFLKERGALPLPEVANILQQTARGINAAHKMGIIHRDLKPDNIFLTEGEDGEKVVKVVDFGIAKLRESPVHTQTGIVLGTPAYMSSEQARGMRSAELDARSDIYSLGVVVYEMLTGRLPFHSDSPVEFLRKHAQEAPPPFRVIAPGLDVPPQVEAVVMKALTKNREERYQSALEFSYAFVAAAAPEIGEELASTLVAPSIAEEEAIDAAAPIAHDAPARLGTAERIPSPDPQRGTGESQPARRHLDEPAVAASFRQGLGGPAESVPAPQLESKLKFIAMVLAALILIVAGVWHFWPSPKPAGENPPAGIVPPHGEEDVRPPSPSPTTKPIPSPTRSLTSSPTRPSVPSPTSTSDPIVGCYLWFNGGPVAIRADHTMTGGPFTARWELLNAARRAYQFTWDQPVRSMEKISADQQSLAGGNQYGGRDAATRIAGSTGLVGTWQWSDIVTSTVTINPDGTFSGVASNASWHGTWQAINAFDGTYSLTTSDMPRDRVTLAEDGSRVAGADQYGIPISGVRTGSCP
ncbi:MAG: serine/threonine-protein kinase [Terriglobia bacterium]